MHRSGFGIRTTALAALVLMVGGAGLQAQTSLPRTNYGSTSFNGGVDFNVALKVGSTNFSTSTTAGSFTTSIRGVNPGPEPGSVGPVLYTVKSYCVDLQNNIGTVEEVNLSSTNNVTQITGAENGSASPNTQGLSNGVSSGNGIPRNVGAAAYLLSQESLFTSNSFLTAANVVTTLSAGERQAAIQLAVWEVAFDGVTQAANGTVSASTVTGTGLSRLVGPSNGFRVTGNLNATQTAVVNLAGAILDAATENGKYKQFLSHLAIYANFAPPDVDPVGTGGNRQDQIFLLPEPSTVGLLASGLVFGLGAMVRRVRRRGDITQS